jgi:DNA-binding GntR family transcriptional regulator
MSAPAEKAHEVAAMLRAELAAGEHPVDRPFPSEKTLCERFGVSRYAARLALGELEASGLIATIHGKGRFIVDSDETTSDHLSSAD